MSDNNERKHLDESKTIFTVREWLEMMGGGRGDRVKDDYISAEFEELERMGLVRETRDGKIDAAEWIRELARDRVARENGLPGSGLFVYDEEEIENCINRWR